jgi:hypothetical protein
VSNLQGVLAQKRLQRQSPSPTSAWEMAPDWRLRATRE